MATRINTFQIKDESITRDDLNSTTVGKSVVKKIIQGSNVTLTSNGADSGTGDVTVSVNSIPWNIVTGKPTTLSGYGITDAASSSHNHDTQYVKTSGESSVSGKVYFTSSFPLEFRQSGSKNWGIHRSGPNMFFAPSASVDNTDWDWSKQIYMNADTGSLYVEGNKKVSTVDHLHDDRYIKLSGRDSISGNFTLNNGSFGKELNSNDRVYKDVAYFTRDGYDNYGTLKITLPKGWSSTMLRIVISGFSYQDNSNWEAVVSGYNWEGDGGKWVNCGLTTSGVTPFVLARFGYDGSRAVILLGYDSNWAYPRIKISEVMATFGNTSGWDTGYSIDLTTDISSVTGIVTAWSPIAHYANISHLSPGRELLLSDGYDYMTTLRSYGLSFQSTSSGALLFWADEETLSLDSGSALSLRAGDSLDISAGTLAIRSNVALNIQSGSALEIYNFLGPSQPPISTINTGLVTNFNSDRLDNQHGEYYLNFNNFTNKPSTLYGYGITDAYTRTQLDNALNSKADKATTLSGYGITNALDNGWIYGKGLADANTIPEAGVSTHYLGGFNKPTGVAHFMLRLAYSTQWAYDIAVDPRTDNLYVRGVSNGDFRPWQSVWHSGNFTPSNYVLKAGDTMSGPLGMVADNSSIAIDAQPNARLGFVKKSGQGPTLAVSAGSSFKLQESNQSGVNLNIGSAAMTDLLEVSNSVLRYRNKDIALSENYYTKPQVDKNLIYGGTLGAPAVGANLLNTIAASNMRPIYGDSDFAEGYNNVTPYNNNSAAPNALTITRKYDNTAPNESRYVLEIVKTAEAIFPGLGGFMHLYTMKPNQTMIQKFVAKIPVGYWISSASNGTGDGATDTWATPIVGTGKWETYIRVRVAGETGTFSVTGHVFLDGPAGAVTWYLASCDTYVLHSSGTTRISDYQIKDVSWGKVTNKPALVAPIVNTGDLRNRIESGFYEYQAASTALGWPETTNSWYHLIASTHSNAGNNYSLQIAAPFYSNKLFFRATSADGTRGWSEIFHTSNLSPARLDTDNTFSGNINISGRLNVATSNPGGIVIQLADDGNFADLQDSYLGVRFTGGVKIHSSPSANDPTHIFFSDGRASHRSTLEVGGNLIVNPQDSNKEGGQITLAGAANAQTGGSHVIDNYDGNLRIFHTNAPSSLTMKSDGTYEFAGGSNQVVRAYASGDSFSAGFEAYGPSQATGYLYVGQDVYYGGGIYYNGDGTPAFASEEEGADRITFYRRAGGSNIPVFWYHFSSNNVTFRGETLTYGMTKTPYLGNTAGNVAIQMTDEWLRLNPNRSYVGGIYAGSGVFRTDGDFQIGSNGERVYLGTARAEFKIPVHIQNGKDLVLSGADIGDIVFADASGVEKSRIWSTDSVLRFSVGSGSPTVNFLVAPTYAAINGNEVFHRGNLNIDAYATTNSVNLKSTLAFVDNREDNPSPAAIAQQKMFLDFKVRSAIGAPGDAVYGGLVTLAPYSHTSGGYATQIFASSDGLFTRNGDLGWDSWANSWGQIVVSNRPMKVVDGEKSFGFNFTGTSGNPNNSTAYIFGNSSNVRTVGLYDSQVGLIWSFQGNNNNFYIHRPIGGGLEFNGGLPYWSSSGWIPALAINGPHGIFFSAKGSTHSAFLGKTGDNWVRIMGSAVDAYNGEGAALQAFNVNVANGNTETYGNANILGRVLIHSGGYSGISSTPSISLAIGDNDTGFNWISDGRMSIWANNTQIATWDQSGLYMTSGKVMESSYYKVPGHSAGMASGEADNASFSGNNINIVSWYGIGFKSITDNTTRIFFNTRDGYIGTRGQIHAEGGFFQDSSRKLKENIKDATFNALDLVKRTTVRTFNYISDNTKEERIGFIAEDTPRELSGESQDKFRVTDTVAVLLKAVQELAAEVEYLKGKLNDK